MANVCNTIPPGFDDSWNLYAVNIIFEKKSGSPIHGVAFFWKLTIETRTPSVITDHFIPELFFDYLFLKEGKIECRDGVSRKRIRLPRQLLKTIHTRPLTFVISTPVVLYGARLSLKFAELFWEERAANNFLKQVWIKGDADDLEAFGSLVLQHIETHRANRLPYAMFSSALVESEWLVNFSERHKRRLHRAMFGLSRKEMQNIRNVHTFLEQTCDFAAETPRIIRHMNPDVFYDQPHLNHIFKKMTGFSPVEYFEANSVLQDLLMSASYNENSGS